MTNKDDPGRMYAEFAGKKMSPDTLGGIIHVWDVEAVAKNRYRSLVWTRSEEFSFPPVNCFRRMDTGKQQESSAHPSLSFARSLGNPGFFFSGLLFRFLGTSYIVTLDLRR